MEPDGRVDAALPENMKGRMLDKKRGGVCFAQTQKIRGKNCFLALFLLLIHLSSPVWFLLEFSTNPCWKNMGCLAQIKRKKHIFILSKTKKGGLFSPFTQNKKYKR